MRGTADAQVSPPAGARADSVRRDSVAADSARAAERLRRMAADTLKDPTARAHVPALAEIGAGYRWDRETIFSSGALNLLELLDRIPGVTGFRTGWAPSPHVAAYVGDFGRLRVFLDGLEIDALDQRTGGMLDLTYIQLWTLEEVVVERAPSELRVHLRSWRVVRTTPLTRADVYTGDLESNSYRGFYGKRFRSGAVLQVGAQQFNSADVRNGGGGDLPAVVARVGWARRGMSFDAFATRAFRTRDEQARFFVERMRLPRQKASRTDAYVRAAYGDPERGTWLQLLAGTHRFAENDTSAAAPVEGPTSTAGLPVPADTADSASSRAQYVAAGGITRWGARLSGAARYRVFDGRGLLSPSARASYTLGGATASAFVEREAVDSSTRFDAAVRWQPLSFVAASGGVGRISPYGDTVRVPETSLRAEVGVKVRDLWVSGGVMSRDTSAGRAPVVFDTGFVAVPRGRALGSVLAVRGPIWRAIGIDAHAIRWQDRRFFLPQYQTRAQLYVNTGWLSRFPSGNFHFLAAVTHEYRTEVYFAASGDTVALNSSQYRQWGALVEIRLLSAILTWQFRNAQRLPFQQVPGFNMPRGVNFYGVRWEFFN